MATSLCTRCWLRLSHSRTRSIPLSLQGQASQQWQWRSRRGMVSMSSESQHKVVSSLEVIRKSADELTAACCKPGRSRPRRIQNLTKSMPSSPMLQRHLHEAHGCGKLGEKAAEAFHQPYTFRKLHISGCSRCIGQCHAKYANGSHVLESSMLKC